MVGGLAKNSDTREGGIDFVRPSCDSSWTPLHTAASAGRVELLEQLLLSRCDPDCVGGQLQLPLHVAVSTRAVQCASLLLQHGARDERGHPRSLRARDSSGQTPLFCAARSGSVTLIRMLTEKAADVNTVDIRGRNALFWVLKGAAAAARALIVARCDVLHRDNQGQTPLFAAALVGGSSVATQILRSRGDVHAVDDAGQTCLHAATRGGDLQAHGHSLCHSSSQEESTGSQVETTRLLLSYAADVHRPDIHGRSCIFYARDSGVTRLLMVSRARADTAAPSAEPCQARGRKENALLIGKEKTPKTHDGEFEVKDEKGLTKFEKEPEPEDELELRKPKSPCLGSLTSSPLRTELRSEQLMREAWQGNLPRVAELLAARADPHVVHESFGQNLAHFAASQPSTAQSDSESKSSSRRPLLELLIGAYGVSAVLVDRAMRQTPLFYAARDGDSDSCAYLMDCKCHPGHSDSYSQTPLFWAVRHGHEVCASLLIACRGLADSVDKKGQSPLFFSVKFGHVEVSSLLLRHRADVNRGDFAGQTCLFQAERACAVVCLEAKADVNHRDTAGNTALFFAARRGETDIIRLFVEHGADVNLTDKSGSTCLFWPAVEGRGDVCQILVEEFGADLSHRDTRGCTARMAAANWSKQSSVAVLEQLEHVLTQPAIPATMKLRTDGPSVAPEAKSRAADTARDLLDEATRPRSSGSERPTEKPVLPELVLETVRERSLPEVMALLEARADLSVPMPFGQNLIFLAASRSESAKEIASLLAGARCNPDHVDHYGQTPLFKAAQGQDPSCTEALLADRADPQQRDRKGKTATFYAAKEGAVASLQALLRARADPGALDNEEQTPLFFASSAAVATLLIVHRCDIEHGDLRGRTALMTSASRGSTEVIHALVDAAANVHSQDPSGQTCLFYAPPETCRVLVACGADSAHRNHKGNTAAEQALLNPRTAVSSLACAAAAVPVAAPSSNLLVPSSAPFPPSSAAGMAAEVAPSATTVLQNFVSHPRRATNKRSASTAGLPGATAVASALRARGETIASKSRREWVLTFEDPKNPGTTIPHGTPQYAAALQDLLHRCPWLDGWERSARLVGE